MKDLISKATFGFLMGQFFPGIIAVFGIAFTYFSMENDLDDGVLSTATFVLQTWNSAPLGHQLFLVGLCVGVGMFIHGLHWASLGALECRTKQSAFRSYWHDKLLALQVLLGPVKMIRETAELFFSTKHIRDARLDENVPGIHKDHMPHFEFLQDFYLYFAQFFIHTAYAILVIVGAIVAYISANGFTPRRLGLLVLFYLLGGLFFLLGRIQLNSLFFAETELTKRSPWARVLNEPTENVR